jgi:hypothetical protein
MFNPIVGMLFNQKLLRWHPVYFIEHPLPGGGGPMRHKNKAHHTAGFETRAEALKGANYLAESIAPQCVGPVAFCVEKDFPWDGEETPAMVVFFAVSDGKAVPVLC